MERKERLAWRLCLIQELVYHALALILIVTVIAQNIRGIYAMGLMIAALVLIDTAKIVHIEREILKLRRAKRGG